MLFHTADFAAYFAVVAALYGFLGGRGLLLALTAASYFFYGYIQPYYVVLLVALTLSDYLIGLFAARFRARWHAVVLSCVVNFGALAYFKYANFGLETTRAALDVLGLHLELPRLDVLLPIGISFHIFQSFAYVMDVLHGRVAPCRNFLHYALYVSWFPQLVAGPIERPGRLIPQLATIEERKPGFAARLPHAAALFAEGFIRKLAADVLSTAADSFFDAPAAASSSDAVSGIVAFGLQIYGDFSGYTRMAQGISHALGVELMENFDRPYAARSFQDFWRRWHISLSTWFRDYVYIPLGGNRKGAARERANILVTHAAERPVARRGLDVPPLGSDARGPHGARDRDARLLAARALRADGAARLARRVPRLGAVPRRRPRGGGRVLPRARARGLGAAVARVSSSAARSSCSPTSFAFLFLLPLRRSRPAGAASPGPGPARSGPRRVSSWLSSRTSSGAPPRRRSSTSGSERAMGWSDAGGGAPVRVVRYCKPGPRGERPPRSRAGASGLASQPHRDETPDDGQERRARGERGERLDHPAEGRGEVEGRRCRLSRRRGGGRAVDGPLQAREAVGGAHQHRGQRRADRGRAQRPKNGESPLGGGRRSVRPPPR